MANSVPFPCKDLPGEVERLRQHLATLPAKVLVPTGINPHTGEEMYKEVPNQEIPDTNKKIREAEEALQKCIDAFTKRADVRLEDARLVVQGPGGIEFLCSTMVAKLPNGQQVDLLTTGGAAAQLSTQVSRLQADVDRLKAELGAPDRVISGKLTVNGHTSLQSLGVHGSAQVDGDVMAGHRIFTTKGQLFDLLEKLEEDIYHLNHQLDESISVALSRLGDEIAAVRDHLDLPPPRYEEGPHSNPTPVAQPPTKPSKPSPGEETM